MKTRDEIANLAKSIVLEMQEDIEYELGESGRCPSWPEIVRIAADSDAQHHAYVAAMKEEGQGASRICGEDLALLLRASGYDAPRDWKGLNYDALPPRVAATMKAAIFAAVDAISQQLKMEGYAWPSKTQ
jgi:hypothetical protein